MPHTTRRKYDTFIVWLYNQNKEHLLPEGFRSSIAHSTCSGWRNSDYNSYAGSQFRNIQNESLEYYELFLQHKNLKRTIRVLAKVWVSVSNTVLPVLKKGKAHTKLLVNQVQRLQTVFHKKLSLHIAGLSAEAFEYQLQKLKHQCTHSVFGLCTKRHPLQLSVKEITVLKELFTDPRFICWPASSMYHYAKRTGLLYMAESTFYKYVNILGLKRKWLKPRPKTEGIKASAPNEFLHVDTTVWELPCGIKAHIVFVSDNFSKAVLGWNVSTRCTAQNVITALKKAVQTIRKHYPQKVNAFLVADGGSENNNALVEDLLAHTTHPLISKIIAQKDIAFSNSSIEAINKIVKRYLRYYRPQTMVQLIARIEMIVYDYCFMRPHGSLKGLLPMEVYIGKVKHPDYRKQLQKAHGQRIIENKKGNCTVCL